MRGIRSRRKLSNVKLTAKYHLYFMGWWVMVALANVGLLVVMVSLLHAQVRVNTYSPANGASLQMLEHGGLSLGSFIGAALTIAGLFVLAVMTGHRIAGPYLALIRTFKKIKGGDTSCRLHFRVSDRLDDLANEFNLMIDAVLAHAGDEAGPQDDGAPKRAANGGETAA